MHSPIHAKTGFLRLFLLAFLLNGFAQAAHEAGHKLVYQAGGRQPVWGLIRLVQTYGTPPPDLEGWTEITASDGERGWLMVRSLPGSPMGKALAAAGGPLAGLLVVLGGLLVARYGGRHAERRSHLIRQIGLMLALVMALTAGLYYLRSPMRSGGDEAEIAAILGIATAWLNLPLLLAFGGGLFAALRLLPDGRTRLKWLGAALLGGVLSGLALFLANPLIEAGLLAGNPLFQPVLGYALPALVINILLVAGVWGWMKMEDRRGATDEG